MQIIACLCCRTSHIIIIIIVTIITTTTTMSLTIFSFVIKAIKVCCALLQSVNSLLTLEKAAFVSKTVSYDINGRLAYNKVLFDKANRHIGDVQFQLTIKSKPKPKTNKVVIDDDTQLEENGLE